MYRLKNNDRSHINHAKNADYKIEVSFSKWSQKKPPIVNQIYDFIESGNGLNFEMIKAVYCDAASQEKDPTVKKHLALFIKEINSASINDQLLQKETIPLNLNEKFRLVTVRYFIDDINIPNSDDIDCHFYKKVIDDIISKEDDDDTLTPETKDGSIIVSVNP